MNARGGEIRVSQRCDALAHIEENVERTAYVSKVRNVDCNVNRNKGCTIVRVRRAKWTIVRSRRRSWRAARSGISTRREKTTIYGSGRKGRRMAVEDCRRKGSTHDRDKGNLREL